MRHTPSKGKPFWPEVLGKLKAAFLRPSILAGNTSISESLTPGSAVWRKLEERWQEIEQPDRYKLHTAHARVLEEKARFVGLYRMTKNGKIGDESFFRRKFTALLVQGRTKDAMEVLGVLGNVTGLKTRSSWRGETRKRAIGECLEQMLVEAFYTAYHVGQDFVTAAKLCMHFSWSRHLGQVSKDR